MGFFAYGRLRSSIAKNSGLRMRSRGRRKKMGRRVGALSVGSVSYRVLEWLREQDTSVNLSTVRAKFGLKIGKSNVSEVLFRLASMGLVHRELRARTPQLNGTRGGDVRRHEWVYMTRETMMSDPLAFALPAMRAAHGGHSRRQGDDIFHKKPLCFSFVSRDRDYKKRGAQARRRSKNAKRRVSWGSLMKSWKGLSCRKLVRFFELERAAAAEGRAWIKMAREIRVEVRSLERSSTLDADLSLWRSRLVDPEPPVTPEAKRPSCPKCGAPAMKMQWFRVRGRIYRDGGDRIGDLVHEDILVVGGRIVTPSEKLGFAAGDKWKLPDSVRHHRRRRIGAPVTTAFRHPHLTEMDRIARVRHKESSEKPDLDVDAFARQVKALPVFRDFARARRKESREKLDLDVDAFVRQVKALPVFKDCPRSIARTRVANRKHRVRLRRSGARKQDGSGPRLLVDAGVVGTRNHRARTRALRASGWNRSQRTISADTGAPP